MIAASIKLMTQTIDGCLILNLLVRRRAKLCQTAIATLQCLLLKCEHFNQIFQAQPQLCFSQPKYYLGLGKRLTQNDLVRKGLKAELHPKGGHL